MNRDRRCNFVTVCRVGYALGVLVACGPPAGAALVNKYTFNDNTANDSIGGQHGVVVDNTGIAQYTGGAIDLSGNNGAGSNQDFSLPTTVGAFVDLPNGIFTSAVNGGTFGTVTLETWLTVQQHRNWAEAFVFGTSNGGEGVSDSGSATAYVAMIPQSGPQDFRATVKAATGNPAEIPIIGTPTPLPANQQQHVVLVLDHNNLAAGPNGTASLYLNNGAPVMAEISGFLDLVVDNNNWLGRSQWPDPLFDGLIDEFRIYDHALTADEVASSFATGPDQIPLPVLVVNRDTGAISLANESTGNVQIKGYSLTSAAGALNPMTWTSIDADNTFDPDGTWTSQSSTSTNLAESVTGGTLDGGTLAPSTTRGVGTPWIKTPFEDLVFGFTKSDNTTGFGLVQYTGHGDTALGRSDLNGDGAVDVADWSLFVPNSFTTFTTDTAVAAYLKGDLDGDKDNDYADFQLFKTDFIAANGAAAFSQLAGAVPEPATAVLAMFALTLVGVKYRRVKATDDNSKSLSRSRTGTGRGMVTSLLVLVALAACLAPRDAAAALAHRYSFSDNVNDSVGTAHATIVDPGAPNAVFANGELDLSANIGEGSNAIVEDAYVDLPNGLITEVANSGTSGAFSFELWATVAETRTWQRFIDVGTSDGGEDTSPGGGTAPYLYIAANSGRFTNGVATEVHAANQAGAATEVGQTGPLPVNVQQHIVGTYNQNDTSAGPDGTFKLYRNGSLIGSGAMPPNIDLNSFTNDNNWLGRSQWNDPVFDGRFNEFRIYDHVLSDNSVAANTFFGPDIVNTTGELLTLSVNKNTGAITMTNSATVPINLDFYRISSAGSALNLAGWNSLDDQNYDAVDGPDAGTVAGDAQGEGWDQAGGATGGQLVELFLGENGSTIAPSEVLNLGNAFNTSVFGPGVDGDLQLTFGLVGGLQISGSVTYVSGPAGILGDYNNNGSVDAADYVLWRNGGPLQNEGASPGEVNTEDYTFWRSRFGAQAGSGAGASAAVPEPGLAWIPAGLVVASLFRRRRMVFN